MSFSQIPKSELEIFNSLSGVGVVIDVGARDDVDYIKMKPNIELHAFEPHPSFYKELKKMIGNRPKTYLNNYGLGDVEGDFPYDSMRQMYVGSEEMGDIHPTTTLPIKRLDDYVKEKGIRRIDFLKIDTEGYDYKVLLGARDTIKMCRYIQYEHWNERLKYHDLLESDFYMTYIGHRNVLCSRKT